MSYEVLQRVSLICGIGSLVVAAVSVALFFWLDIPSVVGFLTGRTRRKGINEIRKAAQEGTLDHRTVSRKNGEQSQHKRQKKTGGKAKNAAPVRAPAANVQAAAPVTTDRLPNRAPVPAKGSELTTILDGAAGQTSLLDGQENLTTVLSGGNVPGTTVLPEQAAVQAAAFTQQPFEIEFDITYIHSDEVI